jgi:predicted DNA-binding protein
MSKNKDISGKFAPKSKTSRKICSVNLTDETWQRLAAVAEKTGKSRNDFLESLL